MTDEEVKQALYDYCAGSKTCDDCMINAYVRDKFGVSCLRLTTDQICDILSITKEEKSMTKKEEIQQEIEKTQKQLAALQEKLKEAEDEVPEELIVKDCDEYYYVNDAGNVCMARCALLLRDARRIRNRRAFLSEEYAEEFAEKTQFIADMLHFKYLYDRDCKPNWKNSNEPKWYVCYNGDRYECDTNYVYRNISVVYFSSEDVAKKCADWLNKKYGYTKE